MYGDSVRHRWALWTVTYLPYYIFIHSFLIGRVTLAASNVTIWDCPSSSAIPLMTLSGHSGAVRSMTTFADGVTLVSASYDYTVKVWNIRSGTLMKSLSTPGSGRYYEAAVIPGGAIAAGGYECTNSACSMYRAVIHIYNYNTGYLHITMYPGGSRTYSVIALPNGNIVSGSSDGG
jgi:WD40 repeat protein